MGFSIRRTWRMSTKNCMLRSLQFNIKCFNVKVSLSLFKISWNYWSSCIASKNLCLYPTDMIPPVDKSSTSHQPVALSWWMGQGVSIDARRSVVLQHAHYNFHMCKQFGKICAQSVCSVCLEFLEFHVSSSRWILHAIFAKRTMSSSLRLRVRHCIHKSSKLFCCKNTKTWLTNAGTWYTSCHSRSSCRL